MATLSYNLTAIGFAQPEKRKIVVIQNTLRAPPGLIAIAAGAAAISKYLHAQTHARGERERERAVCLAAAACSFQGGRVNTIGAEK
jgi:hypothetical protein